ncbi:gamma-glutamyl-gamma-aminobutyrate hydrolase family protein [Microbacterium hydrocarbonoxydans]|uniref:gamma-glutamyl-gamma-aminobutyrate hydrolase family protein n=1 Tax=Microbacterium hydrocarbonoxydans TaxID=273678 RepID=UPI00203DF737|nr:gamma-glutamyl-gamma-aminobutyrate hydrolase family protein [Microbacterium hydrocarbonoxydans]MCM3780114.1 gamma-glutamyl-gamma-aminobutyrate hydrolase family protein [Microbacterium hydrocarbonoxydans]
MVSNASDPAPLIGVTTYLERAQQGVWDVRAAFLPEQYLTGVTDSGGIALLLPPQDPDAADAAIAGMDGLVLSGGADVAPELYGEERHPLTDPARVDRDAWELALFRAAERRRIPVLAICRGLQLVNVARGGTLQQHLPESLGTEKYRIGGGVYAENDVEVAEDTAFADIIRESDVRVHSYHHQGIDRLGDGLVAAAHSDDGLVQAFVDTDGGHVVGVQWHPEENAEDRRLFADLVSQARAFAARRKESAR